MGAEAQALGNDGIRLAPRAVDVDEATVSLKVGELAGRRTQARG